jgi:hypothetical protein
MAEAVTSEGLVIAVTNASGGIFPFACAKNATLSISRDSLELAPRTNGVFREYIQNRMSFTVSGNGLVKMAESNMQPITFFDTFIEGTDQEFLCYLDMIDKTGNYKVYQFTAFITSLSISSNVSEFGSYDYTLQGTGPLVEITTVDSYVVSSGKITARSTATFKLVAVGIEGQWYYNYTVTNEGGGVFTITIGTSFNGKTVKAAYISI